MQLETLPGDLVDGLPRFVVDFSESVIQTSRLVDAELEVGHVPAGNSDADH